MDVEADEDILEFALSRVPRASNYITTGHSHHQRFLPIFEHKNRILYLLEHNQVLIIKGETGCGKSTQIPQYLLKYNCIPTSNDVNLKNQMICVTQPRRIAAANLAARVAHELDDVVGNLVGYCVRFEENFTPGVTQVKFVTEGILNREFLSNPYLEDYSIVMLDEAHERNTNTDVLLGLLKKVLERRQQDFKLIICSATLDIDAMFAFFSRTASVTVLPVEGHSYPIEIFYLEKPIADYVVASVETVIKIHEIYKISSGDILVFLTGQSEVIQACSQLIEYSKSINANKNMTLLKLSVLPLFSALPAQEIEKVFNPKNKNTRTCVVATNLAETSLTIPNIAFVVDSGFVKLRFFNPRTWTDTLVRVPISQAVASQRAGRAGRTRKGCVYRLYNEIDFKFKMPRLAPLEIQRCCLANVILQLKSCGVDNILDFEMPSRMPKKNITASLELLCALGAIDIKSKLTDDGHLMSYFPLEPQSTRVLIESFRKFSCWREALIIVSMLQVKNFTMKPTKGRDAVEAEKCHQKLSAKEGDLITLLNIYDSWHASNYKKSWCDKNFLNYNSLQSAKKLMERLESLMQKQSKTNLSAKFISARSGQVVDLVRRAFISGYFSNSAYLHYSGEYRTIRGDHSLHLHPTSVFNYVNERPKYVTFHEVLHTTREYMLNLIAVKPEWLEELAPHYYHIGTK